MNILGVMCSPRKWGNSWLLLEEALSGAKEHGANTEMVTLVEMELLPCDGCFTCQKTQHCHIKDDMRDIYPKVLAADGIIFATPVYFLNVSGQAKIFIDRLYPLYREYKLANKVGGTIAVATRLGLSQVWNFFDFFFAINGMIAADFVAGFGTEKGDVKRDKHAMKAARELGHLVTSIAEKGFKLPEEYNQTLHRYVASKYGIDDSPVGDRFERP
ncbi:flavodoxin family protein [Chloroflexota bacterium]